MPDVPPRRKPIESYSAEDFFDEMNGREVLNPEYVDYRRAVLEAGGLGDEVEDDPGAKPPEERSAEDWERIIDPQRRR